MCSAIFCCNNLALDTPAAKARTYHDACHTLQLCGNVFRRQLFTIHKMNLSLHIVVDACPIQTLTDALLGILQVVFAHETDMPLALRIALLF